MSYSYVCETPIEGYLQERTDKNRGDRRTDRRTDGWTASGRGRPGGTGRLQPETYRQGWLRLTDDPDDLPNPLPVLCSIAFNPAFNR